MTSWRGTVCSLVRSASSKWLCPISSTSYESPRVSQIFSPPVKAAPASMWSGSRTRESPILCSSPWSRPTARCCAFMTFRAGWNSGLCRTRTNGSWSPWSWIWNSYWKRPKSDCAISSPCPTAWCRGESPLNGTKRRLSQCNWRARGRRWFLSKKPSPGYSKPNLKPFGARPEMNPLRPRPRQAPMNSSPTSWMMTLWKPATPSL